MMLQITQQSPRYPLAELHCHIEGAVPPDLALKQAKRYGVKLPDCIDGDGYAWQDFTEFLQAYAAIAGLFRTADDYADLAEAYLTKISDMGCIYSELFIAPVPPFVKDLRPEDYLAGVCEGVQRAQDKTGLITRLIVVGIRHEGPDAVMAAAQFAVQNRSDILTGFGMAGDERTYHPNDFAAAFHHARDHGLSITVHAGELMGPESVSAALDHLHPDRIGHGVRAIEDVALVERLANGTVTLECCPGSNIALGLYDHYGAHPIIQLQRSGVKVTISSDDPPFFSTSLLQDYQGLQKAHGLDDAEMVKFTETALNAAFTDEDTRKACLNKLEPEM